MSLVPSTPAQTLYGGYSTLIQGGLEGRPAYASVWRDAYHAYAVAGECPIAIGAGDSSILYDRIFGIQGYQYSNVHYLAQMFADYWDTSHPAPKGEAVTIIGNDSLNRIGQFEQAIVSSLTDTSSTPYYERLIRNVEGVVKTIIWTGLNANGETITGTIS
ncbi:hypothetical protein EniLVp02_0138 [Vibrio phage EniLVp02]